MTEDLADVFADFSEETWMTMELTHNHSERPREEYFTSRLLITQLLRAPSQTQMIPFPPRVEALNGADWEWWLTDGYAWYGMVVQAKAINIRSERYYKFNYRPRRSKKTQLELLTEDAKDRRLSALLVCYNYIKSGNYRWNCRSFPRHDPWYGASFMPADVALKLTRRRFPPWPRQPTAEAVSHYSLPLRCLLGCKGFSRSLPRQASELVSELRRDGRIQPDDSASVLDIGFFPDGPPEYVRRLLEADGEERRRLIRDLASKLPVRHGLLITESNKMEDGPDD